MVAPTKTLQDRPHFNRRTVIAAAIASVGVAWSFRWRSKEGELLAFAKRLVALVGLEGFAVDMRGASDSPQLPLSGLVAELTGEQGEDWRRLATLGDSELRNRIRLNIVSDYGAGRMQSVSGWLLSRTEHRALSLSEYLRLVA